MGIPRVVSHTLPCVEISLSAYYTRQPFGTDNCIAPSPEEQPGDQTERCNGEQRLGKADHFGDFRPQQRACQHRSIEDQIVPGQ